MATPQSVTHPGTFLGEARRRLRLGIRLLPEEVDRLLALAESAARTTSGTGIKLGEHGYLIDNEVQVICPHCGATTCVDLPEQP